VTGNESHLATIMPGHDTEAVVLDLVQPAVAGRRPLRRRWQARLNETGRTPGTPTRPHNRTGYSASVVECQILADLVEYEAAKEWRKRSVNRVSVRECVQCGAAMIAPAWSEHRSDHCVRNVWACDACGYQFEDTVYLRARELTDAD
jgi:ribosomal protein L37AE/L43A